MSVPTTLPATGGEVVPCRVPVWLLDVDGVLNASRSGWGGPPRQRQVLANGRLLKLRWAPALVDQLRGWHLSGAVELRWCTSWCPHAHLLEDVFRLPPLRRTLSAEQVASPEVAAVAKRAVAVSVVEVERRPLIWTDDEVVPSSGSVLDRLHAAGVPVHLVAPKSSRGLRPEHLAEAEAFLTRLHGG